MLILVFILAERMVELPEEGRFGWLFILALICGMFLREVGLTLVLASAAYLLVQKRYHNFLLLCTIPVLFYLIWYLPERSNHRWCGESLLAECETHVGSLVHVREFFPRSGIPGAAAN